MRKFLRRFCWPLSLEPSEVNGRFRELMAQLDFNQRFMETIMSDITDKLDAAVNAAIAKIQAAGDVTALNAQITELRTSNADLQAQLDAANADAVKNTDALNAVNGAV